MGPLVKPQDLIPQFHNFQNKKCNINNLMVGIRLFNIGLFKKAILADTFSRAVGWGFDNIYVLTSMDVVVIMLAYTFQIYFDFSGYSDMAVGIAKMMNINLSINFDSPYKAISIRDFWNRWHITLTKFLTQYIYIPLGGSKKGKIKTYINIMIVFLISGIWHGANWTFILWGLLYGLLQVIERIGEKIRNKINIVIQWMVTFTLINFLWLLFRADSVSQWIYLIKQIVVGNDYIISQGIMDCFNLPEIQFLMHHFPFSYLDYLINGCPMFLFLVISMLGCLYIKNAYRRKYTQDLITPIISAIMFCWSLISLSGETMFLYNNF